MTVHRLLADIMEALRVNHVEHEAMRQEMAGLATKKDLDALRGDFAGHKTEFAVLKTDVAVLKTDVAELKTDVAVLKTDVAELKTDVAVLKTDVAGLAQTMRKLGLDFEAFRHDSKIALEAIAELMVRTSRHNRTLESHDLRLRIAENRLGLQPLGEIAGDG